MSGKTEPVKIELNNLSVNEAIEKKAVFIQTLQQTGGNEREQVALRACMMLESPSSPMTAEIASVSFNTTLL